MSETKKPGARDISDLKARLGLKKGIAAPGKPGAAPVPPPPGLAPPAPAQPAVPDARVDPFGAMNAMAAQSVAQVIQQPIVITAEDTKMLKAVRKKSRLGYAKWGGVAVGSLLLGFVIGGISYKNQAYNQTIDSAKTLTQVVKDLQPGLQSLSDALLEAKGRDKNEQLQANDKELTARLKELLDGKKLSPPDPLKLFHSYLYDMDVKLVEDTFAFYNDLTILYDKVEKHVKLSQSDENKTEPSAIAKLNLKGAIAGYVVTPEGEGKGPPTLEMVELGAPVCGDNQPHPEGCGGSAPIGFQYRPDPTQSVWGTKAWSDKTVEPGALVVLGSGAVSQALIQGTKQFVDTYSYMVRITEIDASVTNLLTQRKMLEDKLNQKAQEGKQFAL